MSKRQTDELGTCSSTNRSAGKRQLLGQYYPHAEVRKIFVNSDGLVNHTAENGLLYGGSTPILSTWMRLVATDEELLAPGSWSWTHGGKRFTM